VAMHRLAFGRKSKALLGGLVRLLFRHVLSEIGCRAARELPTSAGSVVNQRSLL
jgi:hypothetical protein